MYNSNLIIKKILILPIIVFALFFSPNLPTANAQGVAVPTNTMFDIPNVAQSIAQAITRQAADMAMEVARISIDSAAYMAGQMLLDQVTDGIITWVKGGFNGSPSFAVDPTKLFLDLADAISGGMASQIQGIATCDFTANFNLDLANMVDLSTRKNAGNKFANQIKCPFTETININATDFYNDFSRGGWMAFETALSDSGNSFGVKVLTSKEHSARQEEARRTQEMRSSWSGGFTDMIDTEDCPSMPAEVAGGLADMPPEAVRVYQQAYCKTTTPGKIVGDRLGQAVGVDMERLGFVDNVNKIIGAVVKQLTAQAVTGIFK